MKVTITVDWTPEEARAFLGLPNVAPMQETVMKTLERRMTEGIEAMTPEAILNTWLPAGVSGLEQLQKMFWAHFPSGRKPD